MHRPLPRVSRGSEVVRVWAAGPVVAEAAEGWDAGWAKEWGEGGVEDSAEEAWARAAGEEAWVREAKEAAARLSEVQWPARATSTSSASANAAVECLRAVDRRKSREVESGTPRLTEPHRR